MHSAYFYADGKDKDFTTWYQLTGFVSLTLYLIASLNLYKQYRHLSDNALSFADSVLFRWAQRFLIAFILLIGLRALFFILNPEWAAFGKKFWYYLCFSILFYYISISGYMNAILSATSFLVFNEPEKENQLLTASQTKLTDNADQSLKHTAETLAEIGEWKNKIIELMNKERLHENPLLTIGELAERLNTHSKKISYVINQGMGMNFNDFVNNYRIEDVIRKIDAGEADAQTLIGIAYDAGFNSKSTFNRAFKRIKSLTPKEYMEKTDKPGFKS